MLGIETFLGICAHCCNVRSDGKFAASFIVLVTPLDFQSGLNMLLSMHDLSVVIPVSAKVCTREENSILNSNS